MSNVETDTNGKYVTQVDVAERHDHDHVRQAKPNAQDRDQALALTPYETPDASVAWQCGGANAPAGAALLGTTPARVPSRPSARPTSTTKYLPKACRP